MSADRALKLKSVLKRAPGNSPTKNMELLMSTLGTSTIVPDVDKFYVFVYKAKTPGVQYDQHPLVLVTAIFQWGFVGFNAHWNDSRQYTWQEVISNLYEVEEDELPIVERIPFMKVKRA